jgi:hypothetical protein
MGATRGHHQPLTAWLWDLQREVILSVAYERKSNLLLNLCVQLHIYRLEFVTYRLLEILNGIGFLLQC